MAISDVYSLDSDGSHVLRPYKAKVMVRVTRVSFKINKGRGKLDYDNFDNGNR